jgi:hypothetical protein
MRSRITAVAALVIAAGLAAGLLAATPAPVAAADGYRQTAASTYVLDLVGQRVKVTVQLTLTNTTSLYYYTGFNTWVEAAATGVNAVSGGTMRFTLGAAEHGFRPLRVLIPDLLPGNSRVTTITYSIPGGAPRSSSTVRTGRAYATFCAVPSGTDSGSLTVRWPKGYVVDTWGEPMPAKTAGSEVVYTKTGIRNVTTYYTCFAGVNRDAYKSGVVDPTSDRSVVLRWWPEDQVWADSVRAKIRNGLPALAKLIGRELDGNRHLTVEEAATGGEYAGFFDAATNTITVDEDFTQASLVEHELAHAWFNTGSIGDAWIYEGAAEWAARTVSRDEAACPEPTGAAAARVRLATWLRLNPRSTDAERDTVSAEYDVACYVMTAVTDAAGAAAMSKAWGALLDGRDPYAVDAAAKRARTLATWQDWLDAVDELAFPADAAAPTAASGSKVASDLLVTYGVTADQQLLDARTATRSAYHALAARVGDWVVPVAVRAPLAAWDFAAASAAITAAGPAWDLTGATDAALAGLDARHGPAAAAWAAATTAAELTAAGVLAQRQLTAATDVAAACVEALLPLDVVQQVGMAGSVMPSLDPAIAAVRSGDTAKAAEVTASVRAFLGGLRAAGETRIAIAVVTGVGLLVIVALLVVLLVRRRRRRDRDRAPVYPRGG